MEVLSDLKKSNRSAFENVYSTTSNVTAAVGDEVWADSSSGALTINAPASPSNGDYFDVYRKGVNNVTVGRNGSTILGLSEDLVIDQDSMGVRFRYLGGTWKIEIRVTAK